MRHSARNWLYQTAALLVGGVVVLVLLPGGQPTANRVGAIATSAGAPSAVAPSATAAETPLAPASDLATVSPAAVVPASVPVATAAATASTSVSAAGADYLKPAPIVPSVAPPPVAAPLPEPAATIEPVAAVIAAPAAPGATPVETASLPGGRIGSSAVNARSGPAADAGKVFVLAAGESIKIGETSAGWTHVYRQDGESGWVYRRYLAGQNAPDSQLATRDSGRQTAQPAAGDPTGRMARVRSPVPVRSAPAEYASMVFVLEPGERVRITEARGQWLRVLTEDGDSGWIPA
jgi:SH3-like domain-containing protein